MAPHFQHRLTLPAIMGCLLLVFIGLGYAMMRYPTETTQPQGMTPSALGIQLNQNVGYVDMHQLQNSNISFVYLMGTQGRSYFDNNYLTFRSQLLGTKMAFGTIIKYSDQSTSRQHYRFLRETIGQDVGTLPILIELASNSRSYHYLSSLRHFTRRLQAHHYRVMLALSARYRAFFPVETRFLKVGKRLSNRSQYAFWQYTSNGHVSRVANLAKQVTMYTYTGTSLQYKERYGQLTQ